MDGKKKPVASLESSVDHPQVNSQRDCDGKKLSRLTARLNNDQTHIFTGGRRSARLLIGALGLLACPAVSFAQCSTNAECDDSVACTFDFCQDGQCQNTPNDDVCMDGVFCNGAEFCDAVLDCQPPPAVACPSNTCDEATDACVCSIDADCFDLNYCDGTAVCVGGVCILDPGTVCNDGFDCTDDSCDPSHTCSNVANDATCDNGLFCDGDEKCIPNFILSDPITGCLSFESVFSCDDGQFCTDDTCDEVNDVCVITHDDTVCDDIAPTCASAGVCDPATETCSYGVLDDSVCDDGDACTIDGVCDPDDPTSDAVTGCTPGMTLVCDDGYSCSDDSCDPTLGCLFSKDPANCDPNDPNNCYSFVCAPDFIDPSLFEPDTGCYFVPQDILCTEDNDGATCSYPACNAATGLCWDVADDAPCDNGLFCDGNEKCIPNFILSDPVTGCLSFESVFSCDDGQFCTDDTCDEVNDVCVSTHDDGTCDDIAPTCASVGTCDPATETCSYNVLDDSVCDDGDACTVDGVCDPDDPTSDPATGCTPGTPLVCDDGYTCSVDTCDPASGCVFTRIDSDCDPNDPDSCYSFVCAPDYINPSLFEPDTGCFFIPMDYLCTEDNDGVTCSYPACNPANGLCWDVADDAPCDNGLFCDGDEKCIPNFILSDPVTGCLSFASVFSCDDGQFCTDDTCDEVNDVCVNTQDNTNCDDIAPTCASGGVCDPATETCSYGVLDDSVCDDGDACTVDGVCDPDDPTSDPTTGCTPGSPLVCDDGYTCSDDSCDSTLGCLFSKPPSACTPADPESCYSFVCAPDFVDPSLLDPVTGCYYVAQDILCSNDDGVSCTDPTCDPGTGTCSEIVNHMNCDDGIKCTQDFCNAILDCSNTPFDVVCDDGLYCNGVETCDPTPGTGGCVSGSDPCAPGQFCNENTDTCAECQNNADCPFLEVCCAVQGYVCVPQFLCSKSSSQ